jgi:4-amino-4-deoxy-L-arabinose transferase-like glycosyltransferase
MDDPLFLWAARHIQETPTNFYGFNVNWYGFDAAASDVIKNPPLNSYYIAAAGSLLGWSEARLHIAFLFPAIAAVTGCYVLARSFCSRPMLAALTVLLTPDFLVSSTTVMCDTMMLGFWVWAFVAWRKALEKNSVGMFITAGLLAGLCALTKYFGICLLPLFALEAVLKRRPFGPWLVALIVPLVMISAYERYTAHLYGHGLFLDATSYATPLSRGNPALQTLIGLAFVGGCVFVPLCYSFFLWQRRKLLAGLLAMAVLAVGVFIMKPPEVTGEVLSNELALFVTQFAILSVVGFGILWLGVADLQRERSVDSLVLFLWLFGTFAFAAFVNWTINARTVLPLVPAAAILLMRALEVRIGNGGDWFERRLVWPMVPAALLAFWVSTADFWLANSARSAASALHQKVTGTSGTVWFEGHWGFQFYMEKLDARAIDMRTGTLFPGDLLVVPADSANVASFSELPRYARLQTTSPSWLATMSREKGAGFYASAWGALPFSLGRPEVQRYEILSVVHGIRFSPP